MFGTFNRPVGAAADVRELEYISALHQTSSVLDTEGTVSAQDVLLFLRSRFGLELTEDDAIDIVKGLSGTARLPLPSVEKKVWKLRRRKKAVQKKVQSDRDARAPRKSKLCSCLQALPELVGPVPTRTKWSCLQRNKQVEDEEDELAAVEAQLKSLQGHDAKRNWEFPALQRQVRKEVPKQVATLVRFDLVQMTSMLLIPSLVRVERHRFKPPRTTPRPQPAPPVWKTQKVARRMWTLSALAGKILKIPVTLVYKERHRRLSAIKESLRPKPETILVDVLRILLGSLDDRKEPASNLDSFIVDESMTVTSGLSASRANFPELLRTVVTKDLIRNLLERHQLEDAANDEVLIQQMMELVGGEGAILDERAFARALTADVKSWPVECEDDVTTTFYDVYGFSNVECNKYADTLKPEDLLQAPSRDADWSPEISPTLPPDVSSESSFCSARSESQETDEETGKCDISLTGPESTGPESTGPELKGPERLLRMGKVPKFKATAPYIDYASDSFRSALFVVWLFCFYIVASLFILNFLNASGVTSLNCDTSFGCVLVETIYSWGIIAVVLSLGGMLIIAPISGVNTPYLKAASRAYWSIGLLVFYMAIPIVEVFLVEYVGIPVNEEYKLARSQDTDRVLLITFLVFGFLTLLESLRGLSSVWIPKPLARRYAILRLLFVPDDIRRTAIQKRSATYKINDLLYHACRLQRKAHKKTRARNAEHEAMMCFLFYGEKDEKCGGFFWSWARVLWKRTEYTKEGLWMHTRLFIGQMGQFMIIVLFSLIWWFGTEKLASDTDEKRQEIIDNGGAATEMALYYVPESWMIYWSFIPGGGITLFMLIVLLAVPFPNTQSIILKYRSGYFQSLHSRTFQNFRGNSALIYYNTGNMIYAAIGAGSLFFILFAGALFLLFWPPTSEFMLLLIGWGIGLSITVGLKMVLTRFLGKNYWKSMYRRRPLAANFSSLGYECWHIGLGGGVMIGRLCQFLLAAAFWIGRIDSQFLHQDVQAFGYRFDLVPEKYTSEILVHEAHRHPFMERLAAMYLMRLKHGEYFGSDAGAAWRKLFVLALMPWLMKYSKERINDFDDDDDDGEEFAPLDEGLPPVPDDEVTEVQLSGNVPWNRTSGSEYFSPDEDERYEDESDESAQDGTSTAVQLVSAEEDEAYEIESDESAPEVAEVQLSRRVSWKRNDSARSEYFSPNED